MNKFCGKCGTKLTHPHVHTTGGGIIDESCSNESCRFVLVSYAPLSMGGSSEKQEGYLEKDEWRKLYPS